MFSTALGVRGIDSLIITYLYHKAVFSLCLKELFELVYRFYMDFFMYLEQLLKIFVKYCFIFYCFIIHYPDITSWFQVFKVTILIVFFNSFFILSVSWNNDLNNLIIMAVICDSNCSRRMEIVCIPSTVGRIMLWAHCPISIL